MNAWHFLEYDHLENVIKLSDRFYLFFSLDLQIDAPEFHSNFCPNESCDVIKDKCSTVFLYSHIFLRRTTYFNFGRLTQWGLPLLFKSAKKGCHDKCDNTYLTKTFSFFSRSYFESSSSNCVAHPAIGSTKQIPASKEAIR